jgi:aspartyl-tRNA(Asn)/glutamyl-tRNA(Gln) amidotransferase subunit C
MAKLKREDIIKLARLSRFRLNEDEIARLQIELPRILDYVEKLNRVDTKGVEPTAQVTGLKNVMRSDEVIDYGTTRSDLLKNVPEAKDGYIKVKKIL